MSSDEYPQNMNCIFCNDSQKQKIKPNKATHNSKNNVTHTELTKNIMESDSSKPNWFIIDSNNTNHLTHLHTDRRKKCSINETFCGHFVFLCRLFIVKLLPIL